MRSLLLFLSALSVVHLTLPRAAFAAPSKRAGDKQAESREYQKAVRSALEEFDAGNYPEARAAFTRAHELYPNARTFRGLGFVAFELRNYGECVEYLEAALASDEKPLSETLRRSTEELLVRARGLIARVRLDVSPQPDTVLVDGVPVETPEGRPLVLEVGDHVLEVRASGYTPERRALKIAGGEELRLSVKMRASAPSEPAKGPRVATPAETSPKRDAPSEKHWYKSPWLWTAVAVVVVGAGVTTAILLRPDSKDVEPGAPTTGANTPPGGVVQALGSW